MLGSCCLLSRALKPAKIATESILSESQHNVPLSTPLKFTPNLLTNDKNIGNMTFYLYCPFLTTVVQFRTPNNRPRSTKGRPTGLFMECGFKLLCLLPRKGKKNFRKVDVTNRLYGDVWSFLEVVFSK